MWRRSSGIPWDERRPAIIVTLIGTALFTLVLCDWQPWNLLTKGRFSTNFYDVQAQAFLHGRLSVPAEVAQIEGFLIDGKTYLYYGPLLAVARLPFAVFGDLTEGRLTRLSMVIAFAVLCTVTFHLARRVRRLLGDQGAAWRPALLVAAVAASPALALAGWPSVYHETELWAFVLILATFVALIDLYENPSPRIALLASLAAAGALLTRVSIGLGAVAAVGIVALTLWRRHRREAVTMLGVAAVGLLAHVSLNLAKFGTLFDLPADRQVLTFIDPARAEWFAGNNNSFFGLQFIPTTLVHYLRPDALAFERLAPFVRFGPRAHVFSDYPLESNTPSSSLTASATLLVVLAVVGAVVAIKRRTWPVAPLLAGSVVAVMPTLAIGYIANRYLVDLLPGLVVLGAVATAGFHTTRRSLAIAASGVLVAWGLLVNVALGTWVGSIERPGFTQFRYGLDNLLFDDTPPAVIHIRPDEPFPRDGVLGIDGPCDGLYVASLGAWTRIEAAAGVRTLDGTFLPQEGTTNLLETPGDPDGTRIVVDADPDAGTLRVTYLDDGGAYVVEGDEFAWDGGPVEVSILSEPTAGRFARGMSIKFDDHEALWDLRSPDLSFMVPTSGFTVRHPDDGGTPLCAELVRRGA